MRAIRSSGGGIVEAFMAAVGGVEECARRGRGWMGDYEHGDISGAGVCVAAPLCDCGKEVG